MTSVLTAAAVREDEDPQVTRASNTYRIAAGPLQGRKVFTLQTLPDERAACDAPLTAAGNMGGFSLHGGVSARANQRDRLAWLCRCIVTVSSAQTASTRC